MWEKFLSGGSPLPQFGKPLLSKKNVGNFPHIISFFSDSVPKLCVGGVQESYTCSVKTQCNVNMEYFECSLNVWMCWWIAVFKKSEMRTEKEKSKCCKNCHKICLTPSTQPKNLQCTFFFGLFVLIIFSVFRMFLSCFDFPPLVLVFNHVCVGSHLELFVFLSFHFYLSSCLSCLGVSCNSCEDISSDNPRWQVFHLSQEEKMLRAAEDPIPASS